MIKKSVGRYSLLNAGAVTKLLRTEIGTASDDFKDLSKLACFVDNHLRSPYVFVMGIDPRHEAFIFLPLHTTVCYGCHFVVRKDKRGKDVILHLAQSAKYVFEHSSCRSLMGFISEHNRPANFLAAQVGMQRIGKTKGTIQFNGKMVDEIIWQCTTDMYNEKYGDILGRV